LHLLEPSKQIGSVDGSSPANSDKIGEIPVTPNSDATATPLSWYDANYKHYLVLLVALFRWHVMQFTGNFSKKSYASVLSDEECVKDTKTNRKRKSIVGTQGRN
jgi:hypothetical protein